MPTIQRTLVIAGRPITLTPGFEYVASRPADPERGNLYRMHISRRGKFGRPALSLGLMPYERANRFLRAFNNRRYGFMGRRW